ncbi:hypothetical protein ACS0TY_005962 [Phlomoides rotata]
MLAVANIGLRLLCLMSRMGILKRHLPFSGQEGLQDLKKIAVRFEEIIYTAATSQSDYLRKISLKMLTMETKSQNPMSNAASNNKNPQDPASQSMQPQMQNQVQQLPIPMVSNQSQVRQQLLSQNMQNIITSTGVPNSAGAGLTSALPPVGGMSQGTLPNIPVQNPNMQNMSNVTANVVGNSMGQGIPSNMYANSQRQIQGRQQQVVSQDQQQLSQNPQQYLYNQQQLQQHLLKQKFQQGGVPQSMMQSQMQQQQQQNLLQQNQLQPSQQAGMQPSLRQSSASSTLQNQQTSLQQPTQSMLQQQPQSVLRQQQQQQQSQQPSVMHQQQPSMPQHHMQQQQQQQPNPSNLQQNQLIGQQNNMLDAQHQQQQRIISQQNSIPNMQQQPTIGQQNNLPNMHQQQSAGQQNNLPNMHQQQLGTQTNLSGFQQQQMVGIQHGNSGLQNTQQPVHMLQQSKVAVQQQMQQTMTNMMPNQTQSSQSQPMQQQLMSQIQSQPGQLQQQMGLQQQVNTLSRDMQQRIQTSGPMLQQQTDQKQLMQTQRVPEVPLTSLDSSSQSGNASGGDWQEEIYQKIKLMNEMYYPELNGMYQRMATKLQQHDALPQQPKNEQLEKLRFIKLMLERLILFLRTNKSDIQPNHKEKVIRIEKQIVNILNSNRPRKPLQQGQLNQAHMHAMQQSQQQLQISQGHTNEGQMNSQVQAMKQQSGQLPAQQMMQLNPMNDANDVKTRHQIGVKSGGLPQHSSSGQRSSYHQQQMKPGTPFSISPQQVLQAASPQIEYSDAAYKKAGTPLQSASANSPFIVPSPSTSMAPSPMPGDSDKINSGVSSLTNAGNSIHHPTTAASVPNQSLAIGTPGISASPLLAEFTSPDGTHGITSTIVSRNSNAVEQPLERLLKLVKSMSPKALSASVSDISSVVSMVDRIVGSAPGNGSRAAVGEDLVAMTKCRLQARNFFAQDGPSGTKKMRRYTSAMPSNVVSSTGSVNDSLRLLNGNESDGESTGASNIKRPRIEANHALEEELWEINQRLIETKVYDVDLSAVAAAAAEGREGTIVKCSFRAVALSPNLKSQYDSAQMSPIQPLRLLVPDNYPNCSPILLDKFPAEVSKEFEDLSIKAKSRFSISLRNLAQPMSLGEIAITWDNSARAVISEYAQHSGGGTFSSKYGTWDNCLSTA